MRSLVKVVVCSCALLCSALLPLQGQDVPVPVNVQISLFSRILSFDRSFAPRSDQEVVIGVLYQRRFRPSLNIQENAVQAFEELNTFASTKTRVRVVALEMTEGSNSDMAAMLEGIDVVYIAPLRAVDISSITAVARSKQIRSLTGVPEYVDAGVAIGIGMRGDRPEILINLTAAKLEGADFSSQLLKLAKIIQP